MQTGLTTQEIAITTIKASIMARNSDTPVLHYAHMEVHD